MHTQSKIVFIVNHSAGKENTDWKELIAGHFSEHKYEIDFIELKEQVDVHTLKKKIASTAPDTVVAVGGDGTLKLVVEATREMNVFIGLVPGGSANGMARELGIPLEPLSALDVIIACNIRLIHLTRVNTHTCIHLADIGFNAYVVKKFEESDKRGMWSYIKAAWKVLWAHSKMKVRIKMDEDYVTRNAAMVVIANGTTYGTGVVINPAGRLDDELFEVVVVRKISFSEIFKMRFSHKPYHPRKTELFQTSSLKISSVHSAHFQVDGEYLGKLYSVDAEIIPGAVKLIAPKEEKK
jgi:YegS/Rv2252/BmrU family lipid kinase